MKAITDFFVFMVLILIIVFVAKHKEIEETGVKPIYKETKRFYVKTWRTVKVEAHDMWYGK